MSGGTKQNGQTNPRSARSSKIKTLAWRYLPAISMLRSEEHTSELQSRLHLVCRLLLEKKKHAYVTPLLVARVEKDRRQSDENCDQCADQSTQQAQQYRGIGVDRHRPPTRPCTAHRRAG